MIVRMPRMEDNEKAEGYGANSCECGNGLLDFAFVPYATLKNFEALLTDEQRARKGAMQYLVEAFERAQREGRIIYREESAEFQTGLTSKDGLSIEARFVLNRNVGKQKWALVYVGPLEQRCGCEERAEARAPGKELEAFAFMGSWPTTLETLAAMALPENWSFRDDGNGNRQVLRQYLCYTFYRLKLEKKIAIDEKSGFAAFNTGLVSRSYDDIYACFTRNAIGSSPWKLSSFCLAGERGDGKLLVSRLNPLPKPAAYFSNLQDLLYDASQMLVVDYNHILLENIERLPLSFLQSECHISPKAAHCLAEAAQCEDPLARRHALRALARCLEEDYCLYNRLRNRLHIAIGLAKKKTRWNYKTAIPLYFPKGNMMSLMLPLCLSNDESPDVALVVQRTEAGNYQGQTILTLAQAYLDARLVCRLNTDWLDPEMITSADELESEDAT